MIQLIGRDGNKRNDIKHFKHLFPNGDNIKKMCEPFGGSFAVSSYMCNHFNLFHINDTDPVIYWIYNNYEKYIDYKYLINTYITDEIEANKTRYCSRELKSQIKTYIDELVHNNVIADYFLNKFIVRGMFSVFMKNKEILPSDIEILKKSTISNLDYKDILKIYENDESCFLFLDPPYIFSNNKSYSSQLEDPDNTDMLYILRDYMKSCKCKVMLILNGLKITRYMFRDMIKTTYSRTYQMHKTICEHLVICNY